MDESQSTWTEIPFGNSTWNQTELWNQTRHNLPGFCDVWEGAQHSLFQTSNLFFAAAFLVPRNFKQNILLVRTLLTIGFMLSAVWGGFNICGLDIMIWNLILGLINLAHAVSLTIRFLPPRLSTDLTELYVRQFKPLRVGKKHFKELSKECRVLKIQAGENYAEEEVTPGDDKLSILIRGRMKVLCGGASLHFIEPYQFIDSPEWEAFHESSADVFQVTISAEEDSVYVCWPRLRLERVLRHRPMLRQVFESMIGKDITHKLYCLNEHLGGLRDERERQSNLLTKKLFSRSLSVDAVNTGKTGQVRSKMWNHEDSIQAHKTSPEHIQQNHMWVPIVASHFPEDYPFSGMKQLPNNQYLTPPIASGYIAPNSLVPPPVQGLPPMALVPVVVPLMTSALQTAVSGGTPKRLQRAKRPTLRRILSCDKEVKFETPV